MKRLSLLITVLSLIVNTLFAGCGSRISNTENDSFEINDLETDSVDNYERNSKLLDTSEGMEVFDLYGMELEVQDAEAAEYLLNKFATYFGIEGCIDDLSLLNETDALNEKYYRFQQWYEGIPVYGKEVIVTTADNKAVSVIVNTDYIETASTEIKTEAVDKICESLDMDYDSVIELKQVYLYETEGEYTVVFVIRTEGGEFIIADATTGAIIKRSSIVDTEQVEGVELQGQEFGRKVDIMKENNTYSLFDEKRNIYVYDLSQNNEYLKHDDKFNKGKLITFKDKKNCKNSSAVDALYNIERVYDFYDSVLGHKSSDGKGKTTIRIFDGFDEFLNLKGEQKTYANNAGAWGRPDRGTTEILIGPRNGKTFADDLDIMGHEYTHSVIHFTVVDDFNNSEGEALNEGIADIIGLMIEAYYNEKKECDWILRDVRDYTKGNLKKSYLEYNDSTECHDGGTIICNVAHMMWDGDPKLDTIEPIKDPALMAELWYRVIMKINLDLDYTQCRTLVELTALNMQREGKLTKEQYQCVLWSCDQAQIKYRFKSGWDSKRGLLSSDVFLGKSNAYPSSTDIFATVYNYENKATEEFDARIFNSKKQIVKETKNEPLVINLLPGIYTIEILERDSDIVTYRGLLRICDFAISERKEFLVRKLNFIALYTKLGWLPNEGNQSENLESNDGDKNVYVLSTHKKEGYENIESDPVKLKGRIVRADCNPPSTELVLADEYSNDFIVQYWIPSDEIDLENLPPFVNYYVVCPWGVILDTPIVLIENGKSVTINEIGLQPLFENEQGSKYPEIKENEEYCFTGRISNIYEHYLSWSHAKEEAAGVLEKSEKHIILRDKFLIEKTDEKETHKLPYDKYFPFGKYCIYATEMTK